MLEEVQPFRQGQSQAVGVGGPFPSVPTRPIVDCRVRAQKSLFTELHNSAQKKTKQKKLYVNSQINPGISCIRVCFCFLIVVPHHLMCLFKILFRLQLHGMQVSGRGTVGPGSLRLSPSGNDVRKIQIYTTTKQMYQNIQKKIPNIY